MVLSMATGADQRNAKGAGGVGRQALVHHNTYLMRK
jgi:hypothetical protein